MNKQELLEQLYVERLTNPWWVTPPTTPTPDNDLTCARRRREMAADFGAYDEKRRAV